MYHKCELFANNLPVDKTCAMLKMRMICIRKGGYHEVLHAALHLVVHSFFHPYPLSYL